MKLKPYQLSLWCDAAVHGRRKWFWLGVNILSLLLALLLELKWPVLALLLLANALLAMYLLHQHHAFGRIYQRKPRPMDALCETVLIDASLIGHGMRLRAAAQPIDVAEGLSLRLGSGALLLGSAMVLTSDELSPEDRSAILSAVNDLNLKPGRLRMHNPVMRREHTRGVTIVTVRDGMSDRHYYVGNPANVAKCCGSIWEGSTREMTDHDHFRIADTAAYIAQGNCHVLAWATALENETPIFLGLGGLGEEVHLPALQDASALRGMGRTLMLDAGTQSDADLDSLRVMMELPDHHARADIHLTPNLIADERPLAVTREPGDSLVEPVSLVKTRFTMIEDTLRRFAVMLGLPLAVSVLAGGGAIPLYLTCSLLAAGIFVGVDLTAPRLRWPTAVICCLLALLARAFMNTQPPELSTMVGGFLAVTAGYCTLRRLCGYGFRFSLQMRNPAFWLTAAAVLMLLILLIIGLLQGLACLLPLGFAAIISTVIALLILLESKLFR